MNCCGWEQTEDETKHLAGSPALSDQQLPLLSQAHPGLSWHLAPQDALRPSQAAPLSVGVATRDLIQEVESL